MSDFKAMLPWWKLHPMPFPSHAKKGSAEWRRVDERNCAIKEWMKSATAKIEEMEAEVERLRAKLVEEREARLWDAYGAGHERNGEWEHSHMADAEWLLRECGIDPTLRWHNAAMIREAIPEAAKRVLTEGKG